MIAQSSLDPPATDPSRPSNRQGSLFWRYFIAQHERSDEVGALVRRILAHPYRQRRCLNFIGVNIYLYTDGLGVGDTQLKALDQVKVEAARLRCATRKYIARTN